LRGVVGEADALLDVAPETRDTSFQQDLLLIGDITQDVNCLLSTVGLCRVSQLSFPTVKCGLTPSSTGTEKKSQPVFLAISLPPGTPGR
jgi:hypothetical protein